MVTSPTTVQEGDTTTSFEIVLTLSESLFTVFRDIVYDVQLQNGSATGKCNCLLQNSTCYNTIQWLLKHKLFIL